MPRAHLLSAALLASVGVRSASSFVVNRPSLLRSRSFVGRVAFGEEYRIAHPTTERGFHRSTIVARGGRNNGKEKMPRGVKKENLPEKVCVTCNRPFTWRKKCVDHGASRRGHRRPDHRPARPTVQAPERLNPPPIRPSARPSAHPPTHSPTRPPRHAPGGSAAGTRSRRAVTGATASGRGWRSWSGSAPRAVSRAPRAGTTQTALRAVANRKGSAVAVEAPRRGWWRWMRPRLRLTPRRSRP